jgi:hypothetical protein
MSHLVLDIEVATVIASLPNGWDDTDKMRMACAVVYSVTEDQYMFFGDSEYERVRCLSVIQNADRVTSYNGWLFDLPVLCRVSREVWAKNKGGPVQASLSRTSDDVYDRILRAADGHPLQKRQRGSMSLNGLARLNLNKEKNGDATDVADLHRRGDVLKIAEYCLQDVRLTCGLMKHIDRTGRVGVAAGPEIQVLEVDKWRQKCG